MSLDVVQIACTLQVCHHILITMIQDDWLQPFSYGKRKCIGESVAKNTVFLMFANVIKKFNINPSKSHPLPDENPVGGLTIGPQQFFAEVSLR